MTATVDTFGLALPPDWVRFPVGGADFEEFVRGQRRRLATEGVIDRTAQRQFELMMRHVRSDCRRADVTMAATMHLPLDGPGDDRHDGDGADGTGLLAASCTISSMSQAALGTDLPLTVHTIAAAMSRQASSDSDGVEIATLAAPVVVELPAGEAVKLVRLHTFTGSDRHEAGASPQRLSVYVQHFLVPYDDGRFAALITFSTPTPEYAEPLGELFDEMAATFRMFAGDDPTDPLT